MIDDDTELCEMVGEYLRPEGFVVTSVHEGVGGIEQALTGHYALVLLDVMLPRLNGFEVLRQLRAGDAPGSGVPVLMLTARGAAVDRIVGLEVGADDYLSKPFDERELVARMRAILRRVHPGSSATERMPRGKTLRLGDVSINVGARTARRGEYLLCLTAVEFDLLVLLVEAAGTVVSREQIARDVLDRKLESFDRSVDTHISHLRRKLGPHADGQERIKTVRSVGYIYTVPANG